MTEAKRKRGRPARDPSSTPGGGGARVFHLGLRFNATREDELKRIAAAMTERARSAGVPLEVTVSALVHSWLVERIDLEIGKLDADAKRRK